MTSTRKKIVILGGGYSGTTAARVLDRTKGLDVQLVTPREGFALHKISGDRAAVAGHNWVPRSMIPLDKAIVNGEIVYSSATLVDASHKTVTLANGKVLPWDILIVATGSRNFSPAEPPRSITSVADTKGFYSSMHEAFTKTKSVLIVGTGSVGIELAGELREYGQKDLKITMVSRSKGILNEPLKLNPKGIKSIEELLEKLHIEVINNDEVASHPVPDDKFNAMPILSTPGGVTLKSGKKIECDLLAFAIGPQLNTDFLPKEWVDQTTHEVEVDPFTLKLKSRDDVFCIGDIAKLPGKKAYFAREDAKLIAKNVIQTLNGKKPSNKVSRLPMMMLPLGPHEGRMITPWFILGKGFTRWMKGKDLFVEDFWKGAGAKNPPKIDI